jgi:hypothetical protein
MTYVEHAPRSIRWDTAQVHDGTLRVELTASHSESSVWKETAHDVIDRWHPSGEQPPWDRVTAGSTSFLVEGLRADVGDVPRVKQLLDELAELVNAEIAARAKLETRAEEERRRAQEAALERDERLTAAFRPSPDTSAPAPASDEERHGRSGLLRRPHVPLSSRDA